MQTAWSCHKSNHWTCRFASTPASIPMRLRDILFETKGVVPASALQSQTGLFQARNRRKQPMEDFGH